MIDLDKWEQHIMRNTSHAHPDKHPAPISVTVALDIIAHCRSLEQQLDRHKRALERAMQTIDKTMPAERVRVDVDRILNPHLGSAFDDWYDEICKEDES